MKRTLEGDRRIPMRPCDKRQAARQAKRQEEKARKALARACPEGMGFEAQFDPRRDMYGVYINGERVSKPRFDSWVRRGWIRRAKRLGRDVFEYEVAEDACTRT